MMDTLWQISVLAAAEPLSLSGIHIFLGVLVALALFMQFVVMATRFKRCPPNKILVIYGRTEPGRRRCLLGGAAFVFPLIQAYDYLDLTPLEVRVTVPGHSADGVPVTLTAAATVAISTDLELMEKAAERLLGLPPDQIKTHASHLVQDRLADVLRQVPAASVAAETPRFRAAAAAGLATLGLSLVALTLTATKDKS